MGERVKEGFARPSQAICVVAYELDGSPISQETADRVVKAVEDATKEEKLAILFTRE